LVAVGGAFVDVAVAAGLQAAARHSSVIATVASLRFCLCMMPSPHSVPYAGVLSHSAAEVPFSPSVDPLGLTRS
jgi:hypothetical protein